jgi:hypothetical protein
MVTEQRIEFNFHRLNEVTDGRLLDDMMRVQKVELVNLVLEHLSDILEHGEDGDTEDDTFAEVKAYPAANGDDSAVLKLYEGPYLAQTHVDDLLAFCTINALGAYENDFDDDEDREDNPHQEHRRRVVVEIAQADRYLIDAGLHDFALKVRELKEFRRYDDLLRFAKVVKTHLGTNAYEVGLPKKLIKLTIDKTPPMQIEAILDFPAAHRPTSVYDPTRNDEIKAWVSRSVIGAAREFFGADRSDNPSHSGLSLGSVALGAALGAAAMHFTMKPKQ